MGLLNVVRDGFNLGRNDLFILKVGVYGAIDPVSHLDCRSGQYANVVLSLAEMLAWVP